MTLQHLLFSNMCLSFKFSFSSKLFSLLLLVGVLSVVVVNGQTASATWALTANSSAVNSGNITGSVQGGGSGINAMSYSTTGVSSSGWGTTGLDANDYYQFAVSPNSGYDFTITNIATTNNLSSSTATGQIQYSYSSSFTSPVSVGTTFALSASTATTTIPSLSIAVTSGQTIYVRIFVYKGTGDGITGTQTVRCKNFVISGTASATCTSNAITGLASTDTRRIGDADYVLNATAISGTVTYTSSNNSAATVTSSGTVSIVGEGATTITASVTANGAYCSGNATQTLTVQSVANPASFTATTASSSQINLSVTANAATNNIVVVYNSTGVFTTPSNGTTAPSADNGFIGGTVLFNGAASGLSSHIGLTANSQYYYKAFSYDISNNYSTGSTANAITTVVASDISTIAINSITSIAAASGGTINSVGTSGLITARGVVYGIATSPTLANAVTTNSTGSGTFTSSLTSLSAQTLYYVRAYATNAGGTTYASSDVSFRTLSSPPTAQPTSINATPSTPTTAIVTLTGSATFPASGATKAGYLLIYSTSTPALVASPNGVAPTNVISVGTQVAITEANAPTAPTVTGTSITGLTAKTTYNVLIVPYTWDGTNASTYNYFTTNAKTTSFTTLSELVTLPYTNNFEGAVSEWLLGSTSPNGWYIASAVNNGGTKAMYISTIANAGSANSYGLAPGGTVTMDASLRVDLTSATAASLAFDWRCNGEIGFDYGEVYINAGGADILISNLKEFQGSSTFTNRSISLTPYIGSIVTIKFRWVNDNSTTSTLPFAIDNVAIAAADAPTVTTTALSTIAINSVSTGGNVTNDGGSTVTAKGVVYGTVTAPTLSNTVISNIIGGTGSFVTNLTGLLDNTTYYVRAYATNTTGTSYGSEVSFTTSSVGQPTVNAATGITSNGFTANWDAVTGANLGYQLEVSTTSNFSNGNLLSEGFEGATFPPTGWINSSWSRSTSLTDVNSGLAAATSSANTGILTTPAMAYPTSMTFYLGRTSNTTAKTLTVEVSTTSQSSGFTTVATYTHSNIPVSSYNQYTVDLSAYASAPVVYIRFVKASSTSSPWRLDDVLVSGVSTLVSGYNPKSINGQASNSSSVTGLSANTTYYYRATALATNSTSTSASNIVVNTYKAITTADYRSKTAGNFSNVTNWEYNNTGSTYIDAIQLPLSTNNLSILHAITLDQDYTVGSTKTFTLGTGGSLIINPTSTLTIAGAADFGANSVILQSTSITNGGAIGTITGTLTGASNVTVQRYTQAQRGYRALGNPLNADLTVSQLTDNFTITGLISGSPTGFGMASSNPSAFVYEPTTISPTSPLIRQTDASATNWSKGKGLYVFVRGNGSEGNGVGTGIAKYTGGTISPVTIDVVGVINTGAVTVNLGYSAAVGADNYNLIANPYPCPINLKNVSGLANGTVYVYNPVISNGVSGQYAIGGGFESQSYSNGNTDYILPIMGAFYIKATGAGQSITFNESDKVTGSSPTYTAFGSGIKSPKIRLSITTPSGGSVDSWQLSLDNTATSVAGETYDAPKLYNDIFDFYSLSSDKKRLAIDYRSAASQEVIPLGIATNITTNYVISLSELTDLPNTQLVLRDKLLKRDKILSQVGDSYSFDITADTATKGNDRFEIGLLGTTVLPAVLNDFNVQLQNGNKAAVSWLSATEINLAYYNLQRSKDGTNFSTVGKVTAKGASNYTYSDDLSAIGNLPSTIYYRLQSIDKDASITYSKTVALPLGSSNKAGLSIFPNPVKATLFAQVTATKASTVEIAITDLQGKMLYKQLAQVATGTTAVSINTASLVGGSYVLVVNGADGIQRQQFVKE